MLSSVTINCQVTKIVMDSGSQLSELYLKHIHNVKFYPSGYNFTQALLVMLVTNIISAPYLAEDDGVGEFLIAV